MRAKQYLQQLRKLDVMIDQKIGELDDLNAKATAIGGIDYSKDRVQTSPEGDASYVRAVNRMIDLQKEINLEIDNFVDKKHIVINQIQGLPARTHVELLYKRYVEYKSLNKIAGEMNYTRQYTRQLHVEALKSFEEIYKPTLFNFFPTHD